MNKPYASYFVSIRGDAQTLPLAEKYLPETGIVPDYISGPEKSDGGLLYEVPEGSMPQWDNVDEVFARMAERFPFPSRTITFEGGKLTKEHWGRILDPGAYDKATIDALVESLRAAGISDSVNYIIGMKLA